MRTPQTATPAIEVQGLEKGFGELEVLRGVDFEVARGSIFALLGSNGAGKTTAVRILSTLLKADAGTARVGGFDVAAQPGQVREAISPTGQFAAADEVLTGRENLILVAKLRHLKNPGAIADDLLARFSLTDAGGRKAATYSGGMRRRLDIAMSLIGNPSVIFLDEPTTGLDPEARIEVWQTVKDLAQRGTTVLLTTQYLGEAEELADRIAILHQGRIAPSPSSSSSSRPPRSNTSRNIPPLRRSSSLSSATTAPTVLPEPTPHRTTSRGTTMTTHFFTDTGVLTARSLRHVLRSPDTIITTAIQPIGFMLLFVYVLGGAIDTGPGSGPYVSYLLPGILVITIAAGIAYKPSPHIYAPLARRHGNACTTGSSRD